MRSAAWGVAALLVAGGAQGAPPKAAAVPEVDVTAWLDAAPPGDPPALPAKRAAVPGCSVATLAAGTECVFVERKNAPVDLSRSRLASALCRRALEVQDPRDGRRALQSLCEEQVSAAQHACRRQHRPLRADDHGVIPRSSQECYAVLRQVLERVQQEGVAAAPCCQCLVDTGCALSFSRCAAEAPERVPSVEDALCLRHACARSCGAPVAREDPALPPGASRIASGKPWERAEPAVQSPAVVTADAP